MAVESSVKDLNALRLTVKESLVEKFSEGSERPCDKTDFLESKKRRERLTTDIKIFVENFVNSYFLQKNDEESEAPHNYPGIENELLALLLILHGQNVTLHPWNTGITVKNCEIIHSQILKLFNCKDTSEIISRNHKVNLTKDIFQILCGDLTASQWKQFPASVACFKWILEMIKQPELSLYLQFVLPPALLLTDDFVNENRIIGTQCLNHIVQNISIAELQLCRHGDVIYSALLPILRIREAALIQATIIPLVSLTTKLEFNLGKKDLTEWSKFDEILEIFLENMELEQVVNLRNCYICNLCLLISAVGHGIIRWSKRLLRIFDEYIQTGGRYGDEKTINFSLKAVEKFIQFSSGVTWFHGKEIFFTLLIALHSASCSDSELQTESRNIAFKCLKAIVESISETQKLDIKKDLEEKFVSHVNFQKVCDEVLNIF